MSNATDTRRKLEAARRAGIKKIDARIAAGEIKTPQGEPLGAIRVRLVRHYEAAFGPYTGKSPRQRQPAARRFELAIGDPNRFADLTPADWYIP